jgi:glyoxylase-like metal-dependent hydrolase (beta-lactamase superfamily II)
MTINSQALRFSLLLALVALPAQADSIFNPERQTAQIADGIFMIRHADPLRGWVHGNTIVVVGEREVLVVDSTQTPSAAREDIAQIRRWTSKPVRYVLNTHWHADHNGGNAEYAKAFPAAAIVAHKQTAELMDVYAPTLAANWIKQATQMRDTAVRRLQEGKSSEGKPLTETERASLEAVKPQAEQMFIDAKDFVYQAPTLTFDRELTIDLGRREVRILHPGRANTAGDAVAYLPREKVLITGDIAVHPIPYAFDGYPADWSDTLLALARLDVEVIIPGHGELLHRRDYLVRLSGLLSAVVSQVDREFRKNPEVTLEEVKKAMDLEAYRQAFAGSDRPAQMFFDMSIGSSLVELAFHERKQR